MVKRLRPVPGPSTIILSTEAGPSRPPPLPTAQSFPPGKPEPRPSTPAELKARYDEYEAVSHQPHTADAGCVLSVESDQRPLWGPRAPRASAALVDGRVAVNYEFDEVDTTFACRPYFIQVVVIAHTDDHKHVQSPATVVIDGLRGSLIAPLPEGHGAPPYFIRVRALGFDRLPSPEVRILLDAESSTQA